MADLAIEGGDILYPGGCIAPGTVVVEDGVIARIGDAPCVPAGVRRIDAAGKYVLPGIVDIHGDAFERQMMPRPKVHFPTDIALLETDRQMVANGITTAFHGVTYSWEPGLRGSDNCRGIIAALDRLAPRLRCDTRFHLRFEVFNVDAIDEAAGWIAAGQVGLLAFNDHFATIREDSRDPAEVTSYTGRTGLSARDFADLVECVAARAGEVRPGITRLAAAARAAGVAQLSHDDPDPGTRAYYNGLGCLVSEFPLNAETAKAARSLGNDVVMGAPNVVRGTSHNNGVAARDMIATGCCTVLASDYYYPAQLNAAFKLVREAGFSLGAAWGLIAAAPARAAGLKDRGVIAAGKRADLVVVDASAPIPTVAATVAAGRPVYFQ